MREIGKVFYRETSDDILHIKEDSSSIMRNTFVGTSKHELAHIDFCQIIPFRGTHRMQYASEIIEDLKFDDNRFFDKSPTQAIFMSDGLGKDWDVRDNIIQTGAAHKFTANGLLNGRFGNNIDAQGLPVRVLLNPLRIGGSGNLWVYSFSSGEVYEKVEQTLSCNIVDNRRSMSKGEQPMMIDFDRAGYYAYVMEHMQAKEVMKTADLARWFIEVAYQFGTVLERDVAEEWMNDNPLR